MKMTVARDSIAVIITDPVLLLGMAPTASAQVKSVKSIAGHPQILSKHRVAVLLRLVDVAAGRAARGGPGLLRDDHAHDHSRRRGLLLHRDHPHPQNGSQGRERHGCRNSDQRRPTGRPTDALLGV